MPDKGLSRVKAFVVDDKLCTVGILAPREAALSKESERYLDSLKLSK